MNLFTYLKNLFNHHNSLLNSNLVIPENIVKIPIRKDFHNPNLIDYYKKEYLSILHSMHDYDTLILEANELNQNIAMTTKLLFNISLKEDIIQEKTIKDRLTYLINKEKLLLYQTDLINIQDEVTARLISLNEIRKDLFLSKRKKDALNNVINRLCLSLHILLSEQTSIISSITRYQNEANKNYEPNNPNEEYQALEEIETHLNWLQQILPHNKQITINHDIKYVLQDLALIEKNIEEYTYLNQNQITPESKEQEIAKLLTIPFDIKHKEELLQAIEKIEIKYRAFYEYKIYQEYGPLVIDESDLINIYNLKFSALTISNLGVVNIFVNAQTDKLELSYYENIIFTLIQDIILGKNDIFNKLFHQEPNTALNIFKGIYFNEEFSNNPNIYNYILKDNILLNILLALNTEDGLYNLFTNLKIAYPLKNTPSITWEKELSLETICFIESPITGNINVANYSINNNYYDLYLLYRKYYKPEEKDSYHLPEGIIDINLVGSSVNRLFVSDVYLNEKIHKNAFVKKLYMPQSLKSIGKTTTINLPASIKQIEKNSFYPNLTSITIHVSKNNYTLLNPENLHNLFGIIDNMYIKNYIMVEALGIDQKFSPKTHKVKSKIKTLNIYFDDLDYNLSLDLTNLEFDYHFDTKNYPTVSIDALIDFINQNLENLINEFNEFQQVLNVEERINIRIDSKEALLTDLELVSNKLKQYVSTHKEEVNQLTEIYNYNFSLNNKYLTNIISLEPKYKLYYHYGLILIDTITIFYKAKFNYLISQDIVNPFIDITNQEFNFYQSIVEETINAKKNLILTNSFAGYNSNLKKEITNLFMKELENKSSAEILKNFYLLNIFLAFTNNYTRLYTLLSNFKVSYYYPHTGNNKFYNIFTIEKQIPLSSLCILKYYMNDTKDFEINIYNDEKYTITKNFLELFHLIYTHCALNIPELKLSPQLLNDYKSNPDNYFLIPEGITKINNYYPLYINKEVELLENMRQAAEDKIVITPQSLKSIKGNMLSKNIKGLILSSVNSIDDDILLDKEVDVLSIPPNLELVDLRIYNIKNLIFNNIEAIDLDKYKYFFQNLTITPKDNFGNTLIKLEIENFIFHYDDLEDDIVIKSPTKTIAKNISFTLAIEKSYFASDVIFYLKEELAKKKGVSKVKSK